MSTSKCFFAYPSEPPHLGETIETAAHNINQTDVAVITSWKHIGVSGQIIIAQICKAIDDSEVFACDLTYLNPNVLFELGYAIARKRKVWIAFDPSIEDAQKAFAELGILKTVGYAPYKNAHELVNKFFVDEPFNKTPLYDQLLHFPTSSDPTADPFLFYLKSLHQTDSSLKISRRVAKSPLAQVVDDPMEVKQQTFAWYAQQVTGAYAVISHLSSSERIGWKIHNAKQSLICGIAHGLGRKLLMIADSPYQSPIDYQDLLYVVRTAKDCDQYVDKWMGSLEELYYRDAPTWEKYREKRQARMGLQALSIGDPIAENEHASLIDYFLPTSAYAEALNSQQSIFVGRKGTGKTANFFKLADELGSDRRNHVCIIKPLDYDLEGLTRVLSQNLERAESGFLVESLWKFLVFSELTKSLFTSISELPSFYPYTEDEHEFLTFCRQQKEFIGPDFSSRLEFAVDRLKALEGLKSSEQKQKISEELHNTIILSMRRMLGKLLCKKQRVTVLVDNLDKSWTTKPNKQLALLLLGLLNAAHNISEDFNRERADRHKIRFSMALFLRSDVFDYISMFANEKDKISFSRLTWNDPEKLVRVIDERFRSSMESLTPDQVWERYFVDKINGITIKEYMSKHIIPRPRDMVFFVKEAISEAVNKGHDKVEISDILTAEQRYSQHAFESILPEYVGGEIDLEAVCFGFIGKPSVLTIQDIAAILIEVGIPEQEHDACIATLRNLTFLGYETGKDEFKFIYDGDERKKLEVLAKLARKEYGLNERYMVHAAFRAYLDIVS